MIILSAMSQTLSSWKCYRCDLDFKERNIADLHKSISDHPVRYIQINLE